MLLPRVAIQGGIDRAHLLDELEDGVVLRLPRRVLLAALHLEHAGQARANRASDPDWAMVSGGGAGAAPVSSSLAYSTVITSTFLKG